MESYGEEVRFELSNLSTSYRPEAKMGKTILNIDIFVDVMGLIIKLTNFTYHLMVPLNYLF